jgi:hypothetical protein
MIMGMDDIKSGGFDVFSDSDNPFDVPSRFAIGRPAIDTGQHLSREFAFSPATYNI